MRPGGSSSRHHPNAQRAVFGTLTSGRGPAWYDDLKLDVQDSGGTWTPVDIADPGFETKDVFSSWHPGTGSLQKTTLEGWNVTLDDQAPASGTTSLRVEAATKEVVEELFPDSPGANETVDVDLGDGLRARVPISLYSMNDHTVGDALIAASSLLPAANGQSSGALDVATGLADVLVVWNVLEHFWPYWSDVAVDWNNELDVAIRHALADDTVDDHVRTLNQLSAAAPDGHARNSCIGETRYGWPPFSVDFIDDSVVVFDTASGAIERGDVILSIDDRPSNQILLELELLVSGSPQWRREVALAQFGRGMRGSTLSIRLRRHGADMEIREVRGDGVSTTPTLSAIKRFDDGVYYVDLSRASSSEIESNMADLARAPGVVFDMRGYPNSGKDVLSHLLTRSDSTSWMEVPHIVRPDHAAMSTPNWSTLGWNLPSLSPHIEGRVAFLTGPGAVSYAESIMDFVEYYHLGEIVGGTTAGTNGDIAEITSPSGCRTNFTGMRVTKHDGSRFHLVGVRPTIPVTRTIAGVIAGRDEVLDKALAYVRGSVK